MLIKALSNIIQKHRDKKDIELRLLNMIEKRPLPLGMTEFYEWSDRIIKMANIPADIESQRFALADMIIHLNGTEDHKEDGYFVKVLRKVAVNQVADGAREKIRNEGKKRLQEAEAKIQQEPKDGDLHVLEKQEIQGASISVV